MAAGTLAVILAVAALAAILALVADLAMADIRPRRRPGRGRGGRL